MVQRGKESVSQATQDRQPQPPLQKSGRDGEVSGKKQVNGVSLGSQQGLMTSGRRHLNTFEKMNVKECLENLHAIS